MSPHTYAMMHIAAPRRVECDRPALSAAHLQPEGRTRRVIGRRRGRCRARCSGRVDQTTASRIVRSRTCIDDGVASSRAAYTAALGANSRQSWQDAGHCGRQGGGSGDPDGTRQRQFHKWTVPEQDLPAGFSQDDFQCVPQFPFVAFEKWENVTPFVLQNKEQFRPGPPYTITDAKFKTDLDEVQKLGGNGDKTPSARTPDQTQIALFWLESSPLKWSRIARTVATSKATNPWENARLFAVLNMALADGYVAMAASKNHYDFWRPVTAIQSGGDPTWTPLRLTPPGPDYPSAMPSRAAPGLVYWR